MVTLRWHHGDITVTVAVENKLENLDVQIILYEIFNDYNVNTN